jgi:hypothetical protein
MKQSLKKVSAEKSLNRGNYGIFPLEIVQRTVGEITATGHNGGKAIMVWFYLLGHVNNVESHPRFGYAFPSVQTIAKDLKISRNAIKTHCDVLVNFGLLETKIENRVSKQGKITKNKLYKPLFGLQKGPVFVQQNDLLNDNVSKINVKENDQALDILAMYDHKWGIDNSGKDTVTEPSAGDADHHAAVRDIFDRLGH